MHVVETIIDFLKGAGMGNIFVNLDFSGKIVYTHYKSVIDPLGLSIDGKLPSTKPGNSVLPLTPPNAVPRHVLPVTSWNLYADHQEDPKIY